MRLVPAILLALALLAVAIFAEDTTIADISAGAFVALLLALALAGWEARRRSPGDDAAEQSGGCVGVPGMVALLAFVAFSKQLGWLGLLIAAVAVALVYVIIGAIVWMGRRRADS